jgi:hypothetical protein
LDKEDDGYYSALVGGAGPGTLYRFVIDGDSLPDPASRFQPEGPFGPSEVIDPSVFRWQYASPKGVELAGQVLSEIHIGTFTREGRGGPQFEKLPLLAEAGITTLEVMPVSDFPGRFGWGYDGVFPYAPAHQYGRPTTSGLHRFRTWRWAWRHPRRRLQPPRPGRLCLWALRGSVLLAHVCQRMGRGVEFRRTRFAAGPRVLREQRRVLD